MLAGRKRKKATELLTVLELYNRAEDCNDIPLTYGNDLIGYAYTGKSLFPPMLDILVLVIFIFVFQITANYLYKKFNN